MGKQAVINPTGDHEDNIVRWAKNLGTSKIRRKLFNAIYGRVSRPRSKKQLAADAEVRLDQQAQNEVEYLYRKHLIDRIDNDDFVKDRSHYLYLKDENVRAHKDEIIRAADSKKLRDSIPTKRSPTVRGATLVVRRAIVTRQALKKRTPLDVLYLMSNPTKRHTLSLDKEVKAVKAEISRSRFRENITLHQSEAADFKDILNGLNDHAPRIVHFSGHGNDAGLAMDDGTVRRSKTRFVSFDLLGKVLAATDNPPDVVVLNSCKSTGARRALLATAKAIVVMEDSVTDTAAVAFAIQFYGAIASGQSLQAAYDQARVAVELVSFGESSTPSLVTASGVNAKKLFLA
jgi:CHAT domain